MKRLPMTIFVTWLAVYVAFAFIRMDPNPATWTEYGRFSFVVIGVAFSCVAGL